MYNITFPKGHPSDRNPAFQILALLHAAKNWHAEIITSTRIFLYVPPAVYRREMRERRKMGWLA